MVDRDEVGKNTYMIDAQFYSISRVGLVYLLNKERKVLIDLPLWTTRYVKDYR